MKVAVWLGRGVAPGNGHVPPMPIAGRLVPGFALGRARIGSLFRVWQPDNMPENVEGQTDIRLVPFDDLVPLDEEARAFLATQGAT